jgi:hypothetical protein
MGGEESPDPVSEEQTPDVEPPKVYEHSAAMVNALLWKKGIRKLPPERRGIAELSDFGEIMANVRKYSLAEIEQALENYQQIITSPDHEIRRPYQSIRGFLKNGIGKFISEADPFGAYAKKPQTGVRSSGSGKVFSVDDLQGVE